MSSEYYTATTYWTIFVAMLIAITTIWLYRTGKATTKAQIIVALLFTGLIFFMHWGFSGEKFLPASLSGGLFFLVILVSAFAVNMAFFLTSSHIFNNLSQQHLQLAHGLRVFIGGGFLMEGVLNVLPAWFSIMDGFMHIASGFFALIAAMAYINNDKLKNKLLWLANMIGVTDILVIVISICFIVWDEIGPHHNMHYVVFTAGPVFLWLHFVSIMKLLQDKKE